MGAIKMTVNTGRIDRVIRLLVGIVLIAAPLLNMPAIWSSATFAFGSMAVGTILVLTGIFQFCPLYRVFGISTCKI
jgi:uncharacterized membrane protein HdeD (DUF308 family)